MNKQDLRNILSAHAAWLRNEPGGTHADLSSADLSGANLSGADLSGANLSGADLSGADLYRARLASANLSHADLYVAHLASADLSGANLSGARLSSADLSGANLSGAIGLPQAPVIPHIDAAILAAINGKKLEMRSWHSHSDCGTTYCRGGFAILLAGDAGAELEAKTSSYLAAGLIYEASRPGVRCPDFFASNETAMADLIACAARDPMP